MREYGVDARWGGGGCVSAKTSGAKTPLLNRDCNDSPNAFTQDYSPLLLVAFCFPVEPLAAYYSLPLVDLFPRGAQTRPSCS